MYQRQEGTSSATPREFEDGLEEWPMISRSSWSSGTGDEGVRVLEIAGIDHPYLGFVSRS